MTYTTNTTYPQIAARIHAADRVALVSHQKPDGDAFGSLLAMARFLRRRDKHVDLMIMGPLEPSLATLAGTTAFTRVDERLPEGDYDLILILDTGAESQLEPLVPWLKQNRSRAIGLDHHAHGDDLSALRIVITSAASTTLLVLRLLDEMGAEIGGEAGGLAEAIFLGLATDTGWFRFPNADAEAFAVAARLLATGVEKERLHEVIQQGYRPARLRLMAAALTSLRYAHDGAVAITCLTAHDFQLAHGSSEDVTDLVNLPMQVGSVRISIMLTQLSPGQTKISFRSKPSPADDHDSELAKLVDVNLLAQKFGGGGHKHAAGARVEKEIEDALIAVLAAV